MREETEVINSAVTQSERLKKEHRKIGTHGRGRNRTHINRSSEASNTCQHVHPGENTNAKSQIGYRHLISRDLRSELKYP